MSAALYKIKHLSLKLPTGLADGLELKGTLLKIRFTPTDWVPRSFHL